jgi:hypothetical protein
MRKRICLLALMVLCALAFRVEVGRGQAGDDPVLPREQVNTAYPVVAGYNFFPANGAELQSALAAAHPGDTIYLQPRTAYVAPDGGFRLKAQPADTTSWIIIRSVSPAFNGDGRLRPGVRVNGADRSQTDEMPKLLSQYNNVPAVAADPGANHYRLAGLELSYTDAVTQSTDATLQLGRGNESLSTMPRYIVVDRCYVHGRDVNVGAFRRGIALQGKYMAVVESYVSNYHSNDDTQAIAGWNGEGPFGIYDNYLEASGENIIFGGADPAVPNLVPSDIEVKRNLFTKRVSWRGDTRVTVKNLFELKNARYVLLEGNVFENSWSGQGQDYALLFKSVNQDGNCLWCVSEHVTVRNNLVRHVGNAVDILAKQSGTRPDGTAYPLPTTGVNHVKFQNNLFYDVGPAWGPSYGRQFLIHGGAAYVKIVHNTVEGSYKAVGAGGPRADGTDDLNPNFTFKDNIVERGAYGIQTAPDGTATLARNFSPYVYQRNLLVNTSDEPSNPEPDQRSSDQGLLSVYPAGETFVASTWESVGFADRPNANFRLAAGSAYTGAASDGADVGVDQNALEAQLGRAVADPSMMRMQVRDFVVNESSAVATVTVVRAGDATGAASVDYMTADQSNLTPCQTNTSPSRAASDRCDYATSVGTLRFAAGEASKNIDIPIINDAYVEPAAGEIFRISLRNPQGAALGVIATSFVSIFDNAGEPPAANPIDDQEFFIRQQYIDFLGRVADPYGLNFWMGRMSGPGCPAGETCDRIDTSKRFFESDEFRERGFFVYRLYDAVLGKRSNDPNESNRPKYADFVTDVARLNGYQSATDQRLGKDAYMADFMNRSAFWKLYGGYLKPDLSEATDPAGFVGALCQVAGVTPSSAPTLVANLQNRTRTPALTVEDFINTPEVMSPGTAFYERGYITMQYFGYLRRDPDPGGYNFWVWQLTGADSPHNHDYRFMVGGFINSDEYRFRFRM